MSKRKTLQETLQFVQLIREARDLSKNIDLLWQLAARDSIRNRAAILDDIVKLEEERRQLLNQIHPYKISPRNDTYGDDQKKRDEWMTRILVDGKLKRIYATSREALEERLLEVYDIIPKTSSSGTPCLAELHEDWVKYRINSKVAPSTVKREDAVWNKYYTGEAITKKSLNTIRISEVTAWFAEQIDRYSLTKREYDRIRGLWRSVESFALAEDRLNKATIDNVPVPRADAFQKGKVRTKENAALSPEELLAFEKMARNLYEKSHFNTSYLGLILNISCGMRAGELSCLRWDGIDHVNRMISLTVEEVVHMENRDGKLVNSGYEIVDHLKAGHKLRIIPLTDEAEQVLDLIRSENEKHGVQSEWVFVQKNGERVHTRSFQKSVKKIYKELGITDKTAGVHTLRRTYATALIDAHLDEKDVQSWMGHTDFRTTKRYYDMPAYMPRPSAGSDVSRALWGHRKVKNHGDIGDISL